LRERRRTKDCKCSDPRDSIYNWTASNSKRLQLNQSREPSPTKIVLPKMPSLSPNRQTTTRQCLKRQEEDLPHVGSWASIHTDSGSKTVKNADDLLSSFQHNKRGPPDNIASIILLDTTHTTPSQQKSQSLTVSLYHSNNESMFYRLTANSISSWQDGQSQLEAWKQDFQRHEVVAYRLARC
jgi:hypothetical protein